MTRKMHKVRNTVFFLSFLIMMFVVTPVETYASSWTDDADQSIYTSGNPAEIEEEEVEEPGGFEKKISSLFRSLANGLNGLLLNNKCDLDYIICGRVNSGGEPVALFTFELRDKNPYGTIAAVTYTALRGCIFIIVALILLSKFVKGMYGKGNASAREKMKESVATTIIGMSSLILMPYIYDVLLYLRDVLLYGVMKGMSDYTGEMGLIAAFKDTAEETQLFSDALVYLGAVCITLFFAFEYIGMALAGVVLMISFAFVVILMFFDKSRLSNWVMQVVSLALTPIIDFSLLTIPAFMELVSPGHSLLKLIITGLIKPARNFFKNALGLSSPGDAVMSGMKAFTMLNGAVMMGRGIGKTVSGIGNRVKESIGDKRKADYHEDMDEAEKYDRAEPLGEAGGISTAGGEEGLGIHGEMDAKTSFGMARKKDAAGIDGSESVNYADVAETQDMSGGFGMEGTEHGKGGQYPGHTDMAKQSYNYQGFSGYSAEQLQKERGRLIGENNEHNENISALQEYNANLQSQNAQLEAEDAASGGNVNREQIMANRAQIAKNNAAIEKERGVISRNNSKRSGIDQLLATKSTGYVPGMNMASGMSERQMDVMRKHATIDNFEEPEFRGLDHAAKAQLYRKRSRKRMAQAVGMTVGGVGGVAAMGTLGVGATMFYDRGTAAMVTGGMVSLGAKGGSAAGGAAGKVVYNAVSSVHPSRKVQVQVQQQEVSEPRVDVETVLADNVKNMMNKQEVIVRNTATGSSSGRQSGMDMVVHNTAAGTDLKEKVTMRQQVGNVVHNPAAREVVASFCREMMNPESSVMQRYEEMASHRVKGGGYTQKAQSHSIGKEMSAMMSEDIMTRIAANGVDIVSPEVYGAVRSNVEKRINEVLDDWNSAMY